MIKQPKCPLHSPRHILFKLLEAKMQGNILKADRAREG